MIYIFAGDAHQARHYATWLGFTKKNSCFLQNASQIAGLREPKVLKCGTFYNREDARYMSSFIQAAGAQIMTIEDSNR